MRPMALDRAKLIGALAVLLKKLPPLLQHQMVAGGETEFLRVAQQHNHGRLTRSELQEVFSKLARHVRRTAKALSTVH